MIWSSLKKIASLVSEKSPMLKFYNTNTTKMTFDPSNNIESQKYYYTQKDLLKCNSETKPKVDRSKNALAIKGQNLTKFDLYLTLVTLTLGQGQQIMYNLVGLDTRYDLTKFEENRFISLREKSNVKVLQHKYY